MAGAAQAQSGQPIKVEVGKTTLLRMEKRPDVIFIADPSVVDIVIEQAGIAFLVGRQTGETNMHLLDSDGKTLMNVAIVVVPQEERHLTLIRGGGESTYSCNPRCSGVKNPHAAGANVSGRDVTVGGDDTGAAPQGGASPQDVAAAAAAAAAAASQQSQQAPTQQSNRSPYAPVSTR